MGCNAKCSDIIFSMTEALTGLGVKSPNTQQLQQIVYIRCHPTTQLKLFYHWLLMLKNSVIMLSVVMPWVVMPNVATSFFQQRKKLQQGWEHVTKCTTTYISVVIPQND
jgi:hypothetical protein